MQNRSHSVSRLVILSLLAALSIALCVFVRFPIFPAAPHLEYDAGDIPLMFAACLFGPWWGLMVTAVTCAVQAFTVSAASGPIGLIMHLFATGAFVVIASLIYRRKQTGAALLYGLLLGALSSTALMIPLNLIFTPLYGIPIEVVQKMLLPVILPFNAIKFFGNSLVTYLLYRPLQGILLHYGKDAPRE